MRTALYFAMDQLTATKHPLKIRRSRRGKRKNRHEVDTDTGDTQDTEDTDTTIPVQWVDRTIETSTTLPAATSV